MKKLTVYEVIVNQNYKHPTSEHLYHHHYDPRDDDEKWERRENQLLCVEITDEQWKAIQKAAIEVIE